jgi:hypothetical protein
MPPLAALALPMTCDIKTQAWSLPVPTHHKPPTPYQAQPPPLLLTIEKDKAGRLVLPFKNPLKRLTFWEWLKTAILRCL